MTSPGAHGEGEGAVVLWKEFGYRPFLDGWNEDPAHKGGEDSVEGRWMPLDTYNALLARANTAKVAAELMRAERDALRALLKEATRHLRNHLVTARWCAEFEDTGATRTNIEREVAEAEAVLPRIDDALGEG